MNAIEIYKGKDNQTHVEVKFDGETVWLNRHQLAILFSRDIKTIGKHINNVFDEGELKANATVAKFATVPSLHEKAANLLYFVVKNHSFTDGNKRIAAGLFLYFLDKNKELYANDGSKLIADHTLVAITIMIAESNPDDKEMMIKLIVNLMQTP